MSLKTALNVSFFKQIKGTEYEHSWVDNLNVIIVVLMKVKIIPLWKSQGISYIIPCEYSFLMRFGFKIRVSIHQTYFVSSIDFWSLPLPRGNEFLAGSP